MGWLIGQMLPSWLYYECGGYHSEVKVYGYDDAAVILSALSRPGAALVTAGQPERGSISHSNEARVIGMEGYEEGQTNVDRGGRFYSFFTLIAR
jgi:hypothetical protein